MHTFRNPFSDEESPDDESPNDESPDDEFTKDDMSDDDQSTVESREDDFVDLTPDPSCLIESIRDIGYTLETAVADIIDNSISAAANNIHINIGFNEKKNDFYLEIIDDGFGMNKLEIGRALTLGSKNPTHKRASDDLGRFGLGLKTASYSQCRRLTVESFSKENKEKNSFTQDLDKLAETRRWGGDRNKTPIINVGTRIIWEKLDRLEINLKDLNNDPQKPRTIQIKIGEVAARIQKHISLIFHRFIDDKSLEKNIRKIQIFLNKTKINPFNPFNESNNATFISPVTQVDRSTKIRYYILPHRDKCEGKEYEDYAGEEGYFENQGFYVYRNYRLITWGTWFKLSDKLNAYKLCRVKIDIGNDKDSEWKIDVKKSNATPPKNIRKILEEYIPRVEGKGRNVNEQKAKKLSTDDRFKIWIPSKVKRTKITTFTLNRKNPLIKKFINNIEHGEDIIREIEESVPYELINLHVNDTKNKFQAIWDPKKQEFMERQRKLVKHDRYDNIDDNLIRQNILKKAKKFDIELTNADFEWIMK